MLQATTSSEYGSWILRKKGDEKKLDKQVHLKLGFYMPLNQTKHYIMFWLHSEQNPSKHWSTRTLEKTP